MNSMAALLRTSKSIAPIVCSIILVEIDAFKIKQSARCTPEQLALNKLSVTSDCQMPVCSTKFDDLKKSIKSLENPSAKAKASILGRQNKERDSPLDKESLGDSTWGLLHTIAAYSPEKPSAQEQEHMRQFVSSLAFLYPCHICAPDFQKYVSDHPPRVSSRTEFVEWCCELHNSVNEKLGKDQFICDMIALDERWLHGHHLGEKRENSKVQLYDDNPIELEEKKDYQELE